MSDKIVQVTGFAVGPPEQHAYLLVGVTNSGKVVMSQGDKKWADVGPESILDRELAHADQELNAAEEMEGMSLQDDIFDLEDIFEKNQVPENSKVRKAFKNLLERINELENREQKYSDLLKENANLSTQLAKYKEVMRRAEILVSRKESLHGYTNIGLRFDAISIFTSLVDAVNAAKEQRDG